MTQQLVIFGSGGVAREVHDIVEAINAKETNLGKPPVFTFLGFISPASPNLDLLTDRGPYLGGDDVIQEFSADTSYVVGIGSGMIREAVSTQADNAGLKAATLIHPLAHIGNHGISIGEGTIIGALSSITTDVELGRHVFIDRNVNIGHDAILEDFCSVYPGASISGNVTLASNVTVGTGARIIQGLSIGRQAFIGAGAVVTKRVSPEITVIGVPAKKQKK